MHEHGVPERNHAGTDGSHGLLHDDPASGALCEFADGFCFPEGTRNVFINGAHPHH